MCDEDSDDEKWETVLTFEEEVHSAGTDAHATSDMWLVDSGATVNVTNDLNCLRDAVEICRDIVVGNGQKVTATRQGWTVLKVDKVNKMVLKEVLYVEGFVKKIISANKLCSNGVTLRWEGDFMYLRSPEGHELRIPRRKNGMCYVTDHDAHTKVVQEGSNGTVMAAEVTMDVQEAHELLGHPSDFITRKTMSHMGVKISGDLKPCEGCLLEKAQRKSVPKVSLCKATLPGERLLLDTTGPFAPSLRGAIYDVYVACQKTSKSWVFHVKKNQTSPSAWRTW